MGSPEVWVSASLLLIRPPDNCVEGNCVQQLAAGPKSILDTAHLEQTTTLGVEQ